MISCGSHFINLAQKYVRYFCSEYAVPAFPSCSAVLFSDRNSCSLCKFLHLVIYLSSLLHKAGLPSQVFSWCVFQGSVLACNSSLICSPFFNILLELWLREQDTAFRQRTACVSIEEIFLHSHSPAYCPNMSKSDESLWPHNFVWKLWTF